MTKRTGIGIIIILLASMAHCAGNKEKIDANPSAQELVKRYHKAVTCWDKSVSMRIELIHSYERRGENETDTRHWTYDIKHRRDRDRCEWAGRCHFKGKLNGTDYARNESIKRIVGDDFFLLYTKRDSEKEPTDAIMGSNVTERLFIMQAQEPDGGILQGRMGGIGLAPKIVDVMLACDSLRLLGQERLSGSLCHIVEAQTKYGTMTVWIAPEKGYNALKYIVRKRGQDILRDDIRIEDQGITEWAETVDAIDVQKIDGVFVPISGTLTGKAKATGAWQTTSHVSVKRSEVVLNPDLEALGAFQISFPEGTEVTHEDIGGYVFRWTKGKFVPNMNDYLVKSLIGKTLPLLDDILPGYDPGHTSQKSILVCFWDMQQRPSRNQVRRLAKQLERFKQKNVVVIAIQASPVDENQLKAWIKENNISFPIGMVPDKEKITQNAWGVRSLPWLILADEKHGVTAEGFSIDELDELIK